MRPLLQSLYEGAKYISGICIYLYICAYVRFTSLNGVIGLEFCAGAALGGTNLARFHSILLPLGSIMSLTKTYTACDILTPGKGTITGK